MIKDARIVLDLVGSLLNEILGEVLLMVVPAILISTEHSTPAKPGKH
jgi:hypothetical protein